MTKNSSEDNVGKPDLVIICGPSMDPDYDGFLKIKQELEANGQKVLLIPEPNADGTIPEKLDTKAIKDTLKKHYGESDTPYTVYKYTHGMVEEGEHYSYLNDEEKTNSREIIDATLDNGNCLGIYDASCFSGASMLQVQEQVVDAKLQRDKTYEFVSDAPLDDTAFMEDSSIFLKELPKYAKQGMAFTPENMQRAYLVTLGDETGIDSVSTYKRKFGADETKTDTINYHNLDKKLDRLMENPLDAAKIPEGIEDYIPKDRLAALQKVFEENKGGLKKTLSDKNLEGDAMILADMIYPERNVTSHKSETILRNSNNKVLADTFFGLNREQQIDFAKEHPEMVVRNSSFLILGAENLNPKDKVFFNGLVRDSLSTVITKSNAETLSQIGQLKNVFEDKEEYAQAVRGILSSEAFLGDRDATKTVVEQIEHIEESGIEKEEIGQLIRPLIQNSDPYEIKKFESYYSEKDFGEMIAKSAKNLQETNPEKIIRSSNLEIIQEHVGKDELKVMVDKALEKVEDGEMLFAYERLSKTYSNKKHLNEIGEEVIEQLKDSAASDQRVRNQLLYNAGMFEGVPGGKEFVKSLVDKNITEIKEKISNGEETQEITNPLESISSWSWILDKSKETDDFILKNMKDTNADNRYIADVTSLLSDAEAVGKYIEQEAISGDYLSHYDEVLEKSSFSKEELMEVTKKAVDDLSKTQPRIIFSPDLIYYDGHEKPIVQAVDDVYPDKESQEYKDFRNQAIDNWIEKLEAGIEPADVHGIIAMPYRDRSEWMEGLTEEKKEAINDLLHERMAIDYPEYFIAVFDKAKKELGEEKASELAKTSLDRQLGEDPNLVYSTRTLLESTEVYSSAYGEEKATELVNKLSQDKHNLTTFMRSSQWGGYMEQDQVKEVVANATKDNPLAIIETSGWIGAFAKADISIEETQGMLMEHFTKSTDDLEPYAYKMLAEYYPDDPKKGREVADAILEESLRYKTAEEKQTSKDAIKERYPNLFEEPKEPESKAEDKAEDKAEGKAEQKKSSAEAALPENMQKAVADATEASKQLEEAGLKPDASTSSIASIKQPSNGVTFS